MKKLMIKCVALVLAAASMLLLPGCSKYSIDENNRYSDRFISFDLPKDYVFAFETDMGKAYYNYYTFKKENDPSGNNITYWSMPLDAKGAMIAELPDDTVIDSLRSQYRNKDKTIKVYDFRRLDSDDGEEFKGYLVYFGIAPFGSDVDSSEERIACVNIVLVRQSDYAASMLLFNATDRATEEEFYTSALTVKGNEK